MDKLRGLKHIQDKKKYKPKKFSSTSIKASTTDAQSLKHPKQKVTSLDSNWDRYEKHASEDHNILSTSTDFALLANAPISQGSHFQFKSDVSVAEAIENTLPNELFKLDLNRLNLSVSTVPFYKILPIDEYISIKQRTQMDKDARENKVKYDLMIAYNCSQKPRTNLDDQVYLMKGASSVTGDVKKTETKKSQEDIIKEPVTAKENKNESEEDLEQWLDDILDD